MADPLFSVADQVVLVSGGSRGIGRAIAAGFAERQARVVITGREEATLQQTAAEIAAPGSEVLPLVCDVARVEHIDAMVQRVLEKCGRIDTLVNVAGVNRRMPSLQLTEEDYDFVVDINLKGAFFVAQRVGQHMVARKGGSQIHIASLNSDRPLKNVLPYAVSKAGLAQMTKALALEWGPAGVRVNAIAPGFVLTDLTRKLWAGEAMQAWGMTNTPQQRLGQPEDMVGTAIFLASAAATFLTGQILYVDGGFTAGWNWPLADQLGRMGSGS
jgi:NAD(P)-dependent dehydrogenase (short-subunit alcohol dehydrogenase family)